MESRVFFNVNSLSIFYYSMFFNNSNNYKDMC